MHTRLFGGIALLLVAGIAAAIVFIEADQRKLRRDIVSLNANDAKLTRAREDMFRAETLLAHLKTDGDAGAQAIHADLIKARADLAALEKKADAGHAKVSAENAARAQGLLDHRDPEKGMTKLEFATNVGRATPNAVLQTLIWAAMKGPDTAMADCVAVEGVAREQAEKLLAALPADSRSTYRTPEQLAALFFAQTVLEATAFQLAANSVVDADHANVVVRVLANGRERETVVPLVHDAGGWRMEISAQHIETIRRRLAGESAKP